MHTTFKTCILIFLYSFCRGHKGTIWTMTSRGKFLFSAGADETIKVWDISDIKNSKGCVQTLMGHRDDVSIKPSYQNPWGF